MTITVHLWWLWAYLGVGAALFLPLAVSAWHGMYEPFAPDGTRTGDDRPPFRSWLRRQHWWAIPFAVVAWPYALWDAVR